MRDFPGFRNRHDRQCLQNRHAAPPRQGSPASGSLVAGVPSSGPIVILEGRPEPDGLFPLSVTIGPLPEAFETDSTEVAQMNRRSRPVACLSDAFLPMRSLLAADLQFWCIEDPSPGLCPARQRDCDSVLGMGRIDDLPEIRAVGQDGEVCVVLGKIARGGVPERARIGGRSQPA